MRIAIASDLHANYEALSALPTDYDQLWVLGDVVNYGPQPRPTVRFVIEHADIAIRGNHDHAVGFGADPRCSPPYRLMAETMQVYTERVLNEEERYDLRDLPVQAECKAGGAQFYLCHAMPSDPLFGYCPPDSPQWEQEVAQIEADFLLVGHTHIPFIRKIGKTTVVNPGSVGQPKTGSTEACYAIWEDGAVELKRFAYRVDKTISQIRSLPIPADVQDQLVYVLESGGELKASSTDK